jgi:serine/threonine protein kinase/tetratricopeptide (TPR) repeat protein
LGREVAGAALDDAVVRWQKVKDLFGDTLEQDPADRKAFLDQACNGDQALRAEVESLLAAAQEATDQAEPTKPDRMLGRRLGAYQIVESIASGGMATVYLAHRADDQYQKRVAIKLIHPGLANDALCRRFRSERQTLAALDHPNIVKLLDGGTTEEGLPYLVMDYVDGQPIDAYCDQHQLTIEDRLKLFRTVCAAVEHAHQNRIIHRDLKPSNILVTADGSLKLLDFGIAKLLSPELSPDMGLMTTAGIHHMTPAYASPEQARGDAITYASDVYSLGVVLYELLTGHRPYQFKNYAQAEVERVICETEAERPSTVVTRVEPGQGTEDGSGHVVTPELVSRARGVPLEKLRRRLKGDLDNIVLKALHKEPQHRYGSVHEFSEDIACQLEDRPVKARANTLQYRTRKFIRRHKTEMVAFVLLLVLGGGWAYSLWRPGWLRGPGIPQARANAKAGVPAIHSLAVLPLRNLSGDPNQEYFADGMTEGLITELSGVGALKVISDTSSMRYKKSDKSLPDIARELNVDGIVEGSVARNGNEVKVSAQLVYGPEDKNIWARSFEGQFQDSLTLQSEVASAIAGAVRAQLEPAEQARLQSARPVNPKALEAYLQGSYHLSRYPRGFGLEEAEKAVEYLSQATAEDPSFARAYEALAEVYAAESNFLPDSQMKPLKKAAAEKALALDPDLSEAHVILAGVKENDWDWQGAQQEYRRAVELNPNSAFAHESLGIYLQDMGHLNEGLKECQRAQELDLESWNLGICLYTARQYDQAIGLLMRYVEIRPDAYVHFWLSESYAQKGMYKEAIQHLRMTVALFGLKEVAESMDRGYAASGYKGAMRATAKSAEKLYARSQFLPGYIGRFYARAGDTEQALKWIRRDIDERAGTPLSLYIDPVWDPLRSDPRFKDIVRRMGLPEVASPKASQPSNPKITEYLLESSSHAAQAEDAFYYKSRGMAKNKEEFAKAISYAERAIHEDPNYAPSYVALAEVILHGSPPHVKLYPQALAALAKALALDEKNAKTHLMIACSMNINGGITWPTGPEDEYQKAIQLKPDSAEVHEAYAGWLDNIGRFEDGMKEHQKAQALDAKTDYLSQSPLMPLAERLERKRRFMLNNPSNGGDYIERGEMEYESGQYADFLRDWAGAAREYGWNEEADAWERAYATGGPQAMIQAVVTTFDETAKHRWWPRGLLIDTHRYAGDREGALNWLETAAKECDYSFTQACNAEVLTTLRSDHRWDPYRSDPRFYALARRLHLAP